MNKREQLINMISRNEGKRYQYKTTFVFTSGDYPRTWAQYDEKRHTFICDGNEKELSLTVEQAQQLGDVRGFNILVQPDFHDKLVQWGLAKRTW